MLRARLAPVLAFALAGGCGGDPSFSVRWRLHPYTADVDEIDESDGKLLSVDQCTELGITQIEVTTRNASQTIVDERVYPCFPVGFEDPRALAPGPEVGPGDYTVTLTALGRRGIAFCDDDLEALDPVDDTTGTTGDSDVPPVCMKVIAFAADEVTIRETGENKRLDDFDIIGAPQCDDGVDNDRDGYTDLADPSCAGDRHGMELGDTAAAQIIVRPSLLGGNMNASCNGLGMRDIELDIAGPTALQRRFPCTTTARTFTEDLAPGDYVLRVLGIGFDDAEIAEVALDPELAVFTLPPAGFRTVDVIADFTIAAFPAPIEAGFAFSVEYAADSDTLPLTDCTPVAGGPTLDQIAISVLDRDLQLVPTATLYNDALPAIVLDGTTTIPCTELLKIRTIEPLVWDPAIAHDQLWLRIEAFPAGSNTACYGNPDAPAPMAPNASVAITLPRLSDQGDCADQP